MFNGMGQSLPALTLTIAPEAAFSTMKGTLEQRLLLFSLLVLVLTVTINTGFSVESFRRHYREGILRRCNTLAVAFKTQIEAVLGLGIPLAEISGLDKRCQEIPLNDPEISYCLIEDAPGLVLHRSTTLQFEPQQTKHVGRLGDDISILNAPELGRIYDLSLPLYDFNGQLAGRIRIGFQEKTIRSLTEGHLYWSLTVLGGASAALFLLLVVFIRHYLVKPLRRMCETATSIAAGDFAVSQPVMKTRELATLAEALTEMAASLSQRDIELRNRYAELENANLELKHSYERLALLSADLGRSQEMYRSLLEDASDAILVCDEDDRVLIANKSAERFFGVSRNRIEKQLVKSFLRDVGCHNNPEINAWYQAILPGQANDTEIRFFHPHERKLLVGWATGAAIVGKNGKRFVQIIIRDATQEEEIRQRLERAARELERLNQMKNSFLGLASHELKTPLTIIMGYVELLQHEIGAQLDAGAQKMLHHIGQASERLAVIVRDMVDVSMLDNRTMQLMSQEVSVNDLVQSAVAQAQEALHNRHQRLHLHLADKLPKARCDRERIVQALGNVLGNAIKFTPDYGQIRIGSRLVMRPRLPEKFAAAESYEVCPLGEDLFPYVEITVIDSGIGIALNEQESIFEKFYEVGDVKEHSSGKISFKSRGAGLGLTIVRGIVGMHGGAVWAESPGYDPEHYPGSTFFILLPAIGSRGKEFSP